MISQKSQVVPVEHDAGGLHFDLAEWIVHHLHEQSKICEELPVLLWLGAACEHDSITPIISGVLQPLDIIPDIQVKVWQVIIHLVLIFVLVHPGNAEPTMVHTFRVGNYDRQ